MQDFYEQHFNPYLNLHRPCAQADIETLPNGNQIRRYKRYQTPLETLMAVESAERFLKAGVTVESLHAESARQSDTEAGRSMQEARRRLFAELRRSA